jgi:hypothetical protein
MTGGMEWDGAGALVAAAACVSQVKEGDCNTEKPMWAAHGGLDFNGREAWDQWDKMQVRQLFWHPLVAFERLSPHVTPGTPPAPSSSAASGHAAFSSHTAAPLSPTLPLSVRVVPASPFTAPLARCAQGTSTEDAKKLFCHVWAEVVHADSKNNLRIW